MVIIIENAIDLHGGVAAYYTWGSDSTFHLQKFDR